MVSNDDSKSPALPLEDENRKLRRAVDELTILNDLATSIGASLDAQKIMNTIVRRSLRAVHGEQGVVTLVDRDPLEPGKTLVRTRVSSGGHELFHLDQCILGWMHLHKRPLLVKDPLNDDRFRGIAWDESLHSILCAPLLVKSELRGVLTIYNKKGEGGFTEEDQRLLAILAGQSAQIVENARLYEEEQALLRMQEELRVASKIQTDLLPKEAPQVSGYDIAGVSIPAQDVGGDYFDFLRVDENRLAFCLGDISGKGLPASLLMANLQATIRGLALSERTPKECLARANSLLFQSTDTDKFATLFYGVLDTRNHELHYCSAGHEKPFLFSQGKTPVQLEAGGMILSFFEQSDYEEATVPVLSGDVLVVFSDGITDATDSRDEPYGEERLSALIQDNLETSTAALIEKVVDDVKRHAGDCPQLDDMTLVIIKRTDKTEK